MARKKKPENETLDEATIRHLLETIANNPSRSEKTSWTRKQDNMVSLIAKLRPIEEQILELMATKIPIMDEIQLLRNEMVKECIHPFEYLSMKSNHIECKFCFRKLSLPSE